MNKSQLEHLLVSAAKIGDDNEIIVIGSQSVLGQFPDAGKKPGFISLDGSRYLPKKQFEKYYSRRRFDR